MMTMGDLELRAKDDIENELDSVYDVASNNGQQVGNVKHMRSFLKLVMHDIASNDEKFSHLLEHL